MDKLWASIVITLKNKLSEPNFHMFVNSTKAISFEENILTLEVSNQYTATWIKDKCVPLLSEFSPLLISYEIKEETIEPESPQLELFSKPKPKIRHEDLPINPSFTFDSFIVGNTNRFAHAAALAVANKPATAYNPLFIYGSVGLGKTHLLHAIAEKVMSDPNNPLTAKLITSEKFTNDLINALKEKQANRFKEAYRNVDILLIDDIQFIAGKEATQEEFFHTFNALHSASKQIVITSDRPPRDIPTLQDRLRTRFSWGLIADLQAPELETRIAILQKKIELHQVYIPDDVIHYVATQIPTNVRELEGALNRIIAYSSLVNTSITLAMASNIIKDLIGIQTERPLTISSIKRTIADYFTITEDDLCSKTRTKELAYARQIAMYLARELTNISLPKIGENFGNRDHSTVMHACDKIKTLINSDTQTKNIVNTLITSIKSV